MQGIRRAVQELRDGAPRSAKTIVIGAATRDLDDACRTLEQELCNQLEELGLAEQAKVRSISRDDFVATDEEQMPGLLSGADLLILPFSGAKVFQRGLPGGHLALQQRHTPQDCMAICWRAPGGQGIQESSLNGAASAVEGGKDHRTFLEKLFQVAKEEEDHGQLVGRIVAWLKGEAPTPGSQNAARLAAIAWEHNEATAAKVKRVKEIAEQRCRQLNCGCELTGEIVVSASLFKIGRLAELYQGVVLNSWGKEEEDVLFAKRSLEGRLVKKGLKIAIMFFGSEPPIRGDTFGVIEEQDSELRFVTDDEFNGIIQEVAARVASGS